MECSIDGLLLVSNFDSGNLARVEKAVKDEEDTVKQPSPVASGHNCYCMTLELFN